MHHQIALFTAEVTIGLGHAISLKWVIQGESNAGTFCDLQGILINCMPWTVRDVSSDCDLRCSKATRGRGCCPGHSGMSFDLEN
jgi:hypothetical protein